MVSYSSTIFDVFILALGAVSGFLIIHLAAAGVRQIPGRAGENITTGSHERSVLTNLTHQYFADSGDACLLQKRVNQTSHLSSDHSGSIGCAQVSANDCRSEDAGRQGNQVLGDR